MNVAKVSNERQLLGEESGKVGEKMGTKQIPEITIKITQAELSSKEDVMDYCKKISEELAATSKLRLEVEVRV
ncbi:MAG: hypothetical protein E7201_06835 [Selenomonas ruminantium]|uniref:Uncharacterized protein n=1 Tax=Selenomonas ruminantium TaxID=971 RepID=A0A927WQX1_SELRU|nr:hypothetical protein [Selenomonas ruminantium]